MKHTYKVHKSKHLVLPYKVCINNPLPVTVSANHLLLASVRVIIFSVWVDQRERDSGIISVIKIAQQINIIYFCKIERTTHLKGRYSSSCTKSASGSSTYSSSSTEASWYYESCQERWPSIGIGRRKITCWYSALRDRETLYNMNTQCGKEKKWYTYMRSCVLLSASENSIGSIPSPVYLQDKKYFERYWKRVLMVDESPMQESASFVHGGELFRQSN